MFGPKSELRFIAASLITAAIVATPLNTSGASAASETYPSTVQFLSDKFVAGKALDGFTPGTPDFGFTMEALLQRKAAGQKLTAQLTAVRAVLADTTIPAKSVISTYLYDSAKKIKPGLAGKFLFTSVALGVPNAPLRNAVVGDLKASVTSSGTLVGNPGNSFDYAWAALGLAAVGQSKVANAIVMKLITQEQPDGGFGTDQTGDTTKSSTDATGISIQAIVLAKRTGAKSQVSVEQSALVAASKYLRANQISGNHWEAFGDVDVNGTAYAAMGLKAAGANVASIQDWLKSRLAPSGGLSTPWSNGLGDVFATAQGFSALLGLSYLDLLPTKK
jgi:hypothetical protein